MFLEPEKCKPAEVIIGEDQPITVSVEDASTGQPFDLSSATEIAALFLNQDNTILHKLLSNSGIQVVSGTLGVFKVILLASETALLKQSAQDGFNDIEVKITIGGKLTIVQLPNSIKVLPRIFPTA